MSSGWAAAEPPAASSSSEDSSSSDSSSISSESSSEEDCSPRLREGEKQRGAGMSDLEDGRTHIRREWRGKDRHEVKRGGETDRLSIDTAVPFSSRLRLRLEHTSHHDHTIG